MTKHSATDPKSPSPLAITGSILGAMAAIAGILGFLHQIGAFRATKSAETVSPDAPNVLVGTTTTSPQETDAWNNAWRNRADCDSLKQYVLDYPTGHFVSAAQAMLSARREIVDERWTMFAFPSNVVASSLLESRASREAACSSAREQMMANMTDGCGVFAQEPSRYRSVIVVPPRNTTCDCQDEAIDVGGAATKPLWHCTIRTTYTCRGEQMAPARRSVCN
jgi:uncharacterized protein YfiM (DUF2279 family)